MDIINTDGKQGDTCTEGLLSLKQACQFLVTCNWGIVVLFIDSQEDSETPIKDFKINLKGNKRITRESQGTCSASQN